MRRSLPLVLLATFILMPGALRAEAVVRGIDSVGIPVTDLERAVVFYRDVLTFAEESRAEVAGDDYDHLFGVFGMRLRTARLKLGDERIELMQFVTPAGRGAPADSRK